MSRILVVEDNAMNRDMLMRRLQRRGYEVVVAEDGVEALRVAEAERPDLILLDLSLPEVDGWETARRLKGHEGLRATPVIALTAHAMAGDRARAIHAGCDEYETKPIDFARLLGKIAALLEAAAQKGRNDALLDLDRMRDVAQGCGWTLPQLAEAYVRNTSTELRSLRSAADGGVLHDVERLAHGLAGAASTVGIAGMVQVLERIEREATTGDVDALVAAAERQFAVVAAALNAWRA